MASFVIFWGFGAALAWACLRQWRRRAVFGPSLIPARVWWTRDAHPAQFWFLLTAYGIFALVCFLIPISAALEL